MSTDLTDLRDIQVILNSKEQLYYYLFTEERPETVPSGALIK